MTVRQVTIPTCDPVAAAVIVSKVMPSAHLDTFVALLLAAPDLRDKDES